MQFACRNDCRKISIISEDEWFWWRSLSLQNRHVPRCYFICWRHWLADSLYTSRENFPYDFFQDPTSFSRSVILNFTLSCSSILRSYYTKIKETATARSNYTTRDMTTFTVLAIIFHYTPHSCSTHIRVYTMLAFRMFIQALRQLMIPFCIISTIYVVLTTKFRFLFFNSRIG
jgi:hypothetical protein